MVLKYKEIYNKPTEESYQKIESLDEKVHTDKLVFICKGKTADEDSNDYDNALVFIDKIRNGETSLNGVKDVQVRFK